MDYDWNSDLVMSSHIDEQLLDRSFKSRDAAFEALQEWAKGQGFAVKVKLFRSGRKDKDSLLR